jgi:hypothetical protein
MTMHYKTDAQETIHNGIITSSRDECGGGKGDEGGGQQSLERPVVGAMRLGWWWKSRWIIHSALVDRYGKVQPNSWTRMRSMRTDVHLERRMH